MPKFSKTSKDRLKTCHKDLQDIFNEVIKHFDCKVIEGHRGCEKQTEYYQQGLSKVQYPNSKHNQKPSLAVDVCPYPVDWENLARFRYFSGFVMGIAAVKGIKLRFGGDWDRDTELRDNRFNDLPHYELVE